MVSLDEFTLSLMRFLRRRMGYVVTGGAVGKPSQTVRSHWGAIGGGRGYWAGFYKAGEGYYSRYPPERENPSQRGHGC